MNENYIRDETYLGVPEDDFIMIDSINGLDKKVYVRCGWVRNNGGEKSKGMHQFITPRKNAERVLAVFKTACISGQG